MPAPPPAAHPPPHPLLPCRHLQPATLSTRLQIKSQRNNVRSDFIKDTSAIAGAEFKAVAAEAGGLKELGSWNDGGALTAAEADVVNPTSISKLCRTLRSDGPPALPDNHFFIGKHG